MYTLLKTMGRVRGERALMDTIDASAISLLVLSQHYTDIYFVIKHPLEDKPKCLFFNDIPIEAQVSSLTISEWLRNMENATIDTSDIIPRHIRGEVYHWDVDSWGFDYKPYKLGYHPKARILDEDKEDIHLFKKGLDHLHAGKYSLITVNGMFHHHSFDENGWVIHQGNKTRLKHLDDTHIGILDFSQVGEIVLKRITPDMIRPANNAVSLQDDCYIDIGTHLSNKTIGIVIGGYLHLLDHTYKQVNDRTIKVDFNNMHLETLYYQMRKYLDVSNLPLTDFGDDRVIGFEFYTDKFIESLLTMPQSFLVIIHNPYVVVKEIQVGDMGIPKRYETGIPPIYPLRLGEGRYPAYKAIKELDRWVLCVDDNRLPLQVRYQKPTETYMTIHNRQYPVHSEVYATAHFMRILSDKDLGLKEIDEYFDEAAHTIGSLQPFLLKPDDLKARFTLDEVDSYYLPPKIINEDFTNNVYYNPVPHFYIPE